MINVISEVKQQSRLFNEPTPPKPTSESLAAELSECIDIASNLTYEMRRLENRLVILQSRIAGLDMPSKP